MIVNGLRLLEREGTASRVGTRCAGIDAALRGGLRRGTITEIYGESGSGKTQFCLQATLACCDTGAVYVSTEVFPTRRLRQLLELEARAQHVPYATLADNVYIRQLTEEEELMNCLRVEVPALLTGRAADLLIVDSVAAVYRVSYDNYIVRARRMRELAVQLLNIARQHNVAILCVNQVTSAFSETEREPVPSLGLSWSNMVSTRLRIAKTNLLAAEPSADHTGSNEGRANNIIDLNCNTNLIESKKIVGRSEDNKCTISDNCKDYSNCKTVLNCKKPRLGCNKSGLECNKSGLECNKSGLECNESGLERNKSGLVCNELGLECNKSGLECNKSGLGCNELGLECNKLGLGCNESGLEFNKSGLECTKSGLECNKSGLKCNKSGLECNKSGLKCNKSGLECNELGLECNQIGERNCIVRSLKVVFAPDLPNSEVHFIVTTSGIKSVTLD